MAKESTKTEDDQSEKPVCGIIMPISATDGYHPLHWSEVQKIIEMVVIDAGFNPNLVSNADDVGIIHNRIVNNLASNPIVVCDVSSKNPNVMFELGLRLAFDKATIILKDELTSYNFDTSPIEHLSYPSTLHYHDIEEFNIKLKKKLLATFNASKSADYSTFLKNFAHLKREIKTENVSDQDYFAKQFERLFMRLDRLESINSEKPVVRGTFQKDLFKTHIVDAWQKYRIANAEILKSTSALEALNEFIEIMKFSDPLLYDNFGPIFIKNTVMASLK